MVTNYDNPLSWGILLLLAIYGVYMLLKRVASEMGYEDYFPKHLDKKNKVCYNKYSNWKGK